LKSEVVLTVSEYSKARIQEHFGIDKIYVTHNAVDPFFLEPYNKTEAKDYIKSQFDMADFYLFVSRFEPRKNHLQLLKTFVENKHYLHKSLALVGNEALDCAAFDAYYNELAPEIKSKIKIFRKVNFKDLVMFTRAADLSVYPSVAEGFGIPPLESLAVETPTICSNTTAMADFDFLNDFLFDPTDGAQMNEKINLALSYNNWAQIKQKMVEKYNWKNAAHEYLKAINLMN
jgi:glycosyltransferase involved in cell wall biosynthesis